MKQLLWVAGLALGMGISVTAQAASGTAWASYIADSELKFSDSSKINGSGADLGLKIDLIKGAFFYGQYDTVEYDLANSGKFEFLQLSLGGGWGTSIIENRLDFYGIATYEHIEEETVTASQPTDSEDDGGYGLRLGLKGTVLESETLIRRVWANLEVQDVDADSIDTRFYIGRVGADLPGNFGVIGEYRVGEYTQGLDTTDRRDFRLGGYYHFGQE